MIYFTSDLHLGQKGINYVHQRPFDDVETMNEEIITNYNRIVTDEDTVYFVGDVCNGVSVVQARRPFGMPPVWAKFWSWKEKAVCVWW